MRGDRTEAKIENLPAGFRELQSMLDQANGEEPRKEVFARLIAARDEIEEMAADGMTSTQIADALRVQRHVFLLAMQNHPGIMDSIIFGNAHGVRRAARAIGKAIEKGNISAALGYLDRRGGWNEKQKVAQQSEQILQVSASPDVKKAESLVLENREFVTNDQESKLLESGDRIDISNIVQLTKMQSELLEKYSGPNLEPEISGES